MMTYAELEQFFTGLVATAQSRGITCAITSGMACVHFGVAEATKDCDVLCAAHAADKFLDLIAETKIGELEALYRGNISPPLGARWMRGGWTSHFTWKTKPDETCLDVFGVAPRASGPWDERLRGLYAHPNIVAEMKRTNRDKDWPFATALGGQMLDAGEARGWLHLYDLNVLRQFAVSSAPDDSLKHARPILRLEPFTDTPLLKRLLMAERAFWCEMDEMRIRIYQRFLRPYTNAVRCAEGKTARLRESHAIRIACATEHLPERPLVDYGLARMVREIRETVAVTVGPDVVEWMPAAEGNFHGLMP